jgi:hypothetical protein
MIINNLTSQDLSFNIDTGIDLKGQQFRTVIAAGSSATISNTMMFLLMLNPKFQSAYANGDISVTYDTGDATFFGRIQSLLGGTL